MWKSYTILIISLLTSWSSKGQANYFILDTLSNNDIYLEEVDYRYGCTYQFTTEIINDSIFLILPEGVPRGYYEAYYDNDTNRLALVYYNNGSMTYGQQFYADGTMKSDTEYNSVGAFHGLQIWYNRSGVEVWHAEYDFGLLKPQYDLAYLELENETEVLLDNKKGFGLYTFTPTPSRARREQIQLNENGTFVYENSTYDCHYCNRYEGTWTAADNFIYLELKDPRGWRTPIRKFAITATARLTRLELMEVKDWGVEWYHSEYRKIDFKN